MYEKKVTVPVLAPITRFMEHLPRDGDVELSVLKGHLLVEEALTRLIAQSFNNPDYLPDAGLKFSQKVVLAKAVDKLDHQIWIWGALDRLNKARNALSHLLDDKKLEQRIKDFVEYVETNEESPKSEETPPFSRFQWAVFRVFSVISVRAQFDPAETRRKIYAELLIGKPAQPGGSGLFSTKA